MHALERAALGLRANERAACGLAEWMIEPRTRGALVNTGSCPLLLPLSTALWTMKDWLGWKSVGRL